MFSTRYYPITIIAGFNLVTLFVYLGAPYVYFTGNFGLSALFVFANICLLTAGYMVGCKLGARKFVPAVKTKRIAGNRRMATFFIAFYAATFLLKYAYLLRVPVLDISGMINLLLVGWYDPKLGYILAIETSSRAPTVPWTLYFLTATVNGLFFIAGFMLWPDMSRLKRFIFIFFLAIELFYWIGRGTNFGVIMLVVMFLFAKAASGGGVDKRVIRYSVISLFIAIIAFLALMSFRTDGIDSSSLQRFAPIGGVVNEESFVLSMVPDHWHVLLMVTISYLSQGYHYLSMSFDKEFSSTLLGGWNSSVADLYAILGVDARMNSYIYKLELDGVDPMVNWHSAYVWFANDVSFAGVPFIVLMIGFFMGLAWAGARISDDLLSKIVFVLLAGMSVFLFANTNFIAYHFYAFCAAFLLWTFRMFVGRRVGKGYR